MSSRDGEFEFESEFEGEGEFESEDFVNPQRRLSRGPSSEALMAHLGNAAASAESEDEAEAFIGALVPLAARLIPRVAPAVMRAAPQLIRGISNVAQRLRSNPATQQLVRTLPTIARNTVGSLARQVGQGRPITPQTAVRTLAQQTARVISNPRAATAAYQRNRALDRRYHQTVARPTSRPVPPRPPYRPRPNYLPRPVYTPRPRYPPRPGYGVGGAVASGVAAGMPGGYPGGASPYQGGVDAGGGGYDDGSAVTTRAVTAADTRRPKRRCTSETRPRVRVAVREATATRSRRPQRSVTETTDRGRRVCLCASSSSNTSLSSKASTRVSR